MWSRSTRQSGRKGSQRSHNCWGTRRLAKLPPTFVGRIIFLDIIRTWQERVAAAPRGGRLLSEQLIRPSSRAQGAETATAEGGFISPRAKERGEEGVTVVMQRATEKIVLRLGTRSLERREPQIWEVADKD